MNLQPDPEMPGRWINLDWQPDTPGTFAVVVGVSRYNHLDGQARLALGQLAVSALTAVRFLEWLRDSYCLAGCPLAVCHLLLSPTGEEAALGGLFTQHPCEPSFNGCTTAIGRWFQDMENLPKAAAKESRSFFFFSGHGLEIYEGQQILLPSDYLAPPAKSVNLAMSTSNLTRGLRALQIPTHFFFLDACRSDHDSLDQLEAVKGTEILNVPKRRFNNPDAYVPVLYATAGTAWQPRELKDQVSVFGSALLDGLRAQPDFRPTRGENDTWQVQPEPLRGFVRKRVKAILRRHGPNYVQDVRLSDSIDAPVTEVDFDPGRPDPKIIDGLETAVVRTERTHGNSPPIEKRLIETPVRPRNLSEASDLVKSRFLGEILAEGVTVYHLQTGSKRGTARDYKLHNVVRSRHDGSVRLEISVPPGTTVRAEPPAGSSWIAIDDGVRRFGFVLPNDSRPPIFAVEVTEGVAEGKPQITQLRVFLARSSKGLLGQAARLWNRYDQIGPLNAVAKIDLRGLEEALRYKLDSPLAALVAGTVLLRARAWNQLHDWLGNLADFFPTLPDGPVLWNEQLLSKERADPADQRIIDGLLSLEKRGLPFTADAFSYAVRQVRDALEDENLSGDHHERLSNLQHRLGQALRFLRSGSLFCVFAGPPRLLRRQLIMRWR